MYFMDEVEQFNTFLRYNGLLLALGAVAVLVFVILFIFLSGRKRKSDLSFAPCIEALGGIENINIAKSSGSRIALSLNDYEKVDYEKLKGLGVSSFIKMSDKLTIVLGVDSKNLEKAINEKKAHKAF